MKNRHLQRWECRVTAHLSLTGSFTSLAEWLWPSLLRFLETEAQSTMPLVSRSEYVLWTSGALLYLLAHADEESA